MSNKYHTKKIQFSSGHRVLHDVGDCGDLHGHNYTAFVTAKSEKPFDACIFENTIQGWVNEYWHGTTLLWNMDPLRNVLGRYPKQSRGIYVCNFDPTVENLSRHLCNYVCPSLFRETGVVVVNVRLYQNEGVFFDAQKVVNNKPGMEK